MDASAAKAMPGVLQILNMGDFIAVVADSYWQAQQALNGITAEYTTAESKIRSSADQSAAFAAALDAAGETGGEEVLAAEPVTQGAREEEQPGEDDGVRVDDPGELGLAGPRLPGEVRQCHVEATDRGDDGHQREGDDDEDRTGAAGAQRRGVGGGGRADHGGWRVGVCGWWGHVRINSVSQPGIARAGDAVGVAPPRGSSKTQS